MNLKMLNVGISIGSAHKVRHKYRYIQSYKNTRKLTAFNNNTHNIATFENQGSKIEEVL